MALEQVGKLQTRLTEQDQLLAAMDKRLKLVESVSPKTAHRAKIPVQPFPDRLRQLGCEKPSKKA